MFFLNDLFVFVLAQKRTNLEYLDLFNRNTKFYVLQKIVLMKRVALAVCIKSKRL